MSNLKSSLNVLCNNKNIRNALVITKDGMVIETSLDDMRESESLGALMSHIALTIKQTLAAAGHQDYTRYVMQSSKGLIFLVDLGKSVLIALTDLEIDSGKVNVALFQAATEIKKSGRLDI